MSLIELAEKNGELDVVAKDMELFTRTCSLSRELSGVLKKPIVKSPKKLLILNSLFKDKMSKISLAFFSLVTKKSREVYLESIALEFLRQWKMKKGIVDAYIVCPIPLNEEIRDRVKSVIEGSVGGSIDLHMDQNEELLGGFILKIQDRQIDESIKTKLSRIRRNLSQGVNK